MCMEITNTACRTYFVQFLDTAFKTDMEQAAELALTKGTGEEPADSGRRPSGVKLTRNKSSFFTAETEITPQAQQSSPSIRSDYVSHLPLSQAISLQYVALIAFIHNMEKESVDIMKM